MDGKHAEKVVSVHLFGLQNTFNGSANVSSANVTEERRFNQKGIKGTVIQKDAWSVEEERECFMDIDYTLTFKHNKDVNKYQFKYEMNIRPASD